MDFNKYKIKTPKQLMEFLNKNLKYGFTYRNKIYTEDNPNFNDNMNKFYKVRLKKDFIKSGYGVCWDFCEFEREFFSSLKIKHECYFIVNFLTRIKGGPTHTFLIYEQNNKWYWFEYSWFNFRGIWEYSSRGEALKDIINKFISLNAQKYNHTELYKTNRITKRLNTFEFCEHCFNQQKIDLNKIIK